MCSVMLGELFFFFFNDTATTEIYTLSLHDALPICGVRTTGTSAGPIDQHCRTAAVEPDHDVLGHVRVRVRVRRLHGRSEEHTSELQSRQYLVCRLLLEKKKHTPHCYTAKTKPPPPS